MAECLPAIRSAQSVEQYKQSLAPLLRRLQAPAESGVQHVWIHYDVDHSAFASEQHGAKPATVDLGAGVVATVPLSEAAIATIPEDDAHDGEPKDAYPRTEWRALSAFKLWGAMHYFFAYRDLMDTDWDDEFAKFLPKFIDAKTALEYHLVVAEAVTKLCDSRTEASSGLLDEYFGPGTVPLRLRLIDKKPLVSEVLAESARAAGIEVGDIVARVDGEDMVKRIDREANYLPASTHQALSDLVMHRILNGPAGSEATLTVRHHDGRENGVKLKRDYSDKPDRSAAVKPLSGKIAYVDVTRAQPADFESMLTKPAVILDARGDLAGDARAIAAKFNDKAGQAGAIVTGPLVLAPDLPSETMLTRSHSFFAVEEVPVSAKPYAGTVVMLIDERTIGEAEHLGLLLEAARKIPFIGSPSAGAFSKLSTMSLPGGITVRFSATDVRHGNTGKLQREGLVPTVEAAPELGDIRSGRDVVLERAVEYLAQQH